MVVDIPGELNLKDYGIHSPNINTISLLELSSIDPNKRAENIDLDGFLRISRNYEKLIKENLEDF